MFRYPTLVDCGLHHAAMTIAANLPSQISNPKLKPRQLIRRINISLLQFSRQIIALTTRKNRNNPSKRIDNHVLCHPQIEIFPTLQNIISFFATPAHNLKNEIGNEIVNMFSRHILQIHSNITDPIRLIRSPDPALGRNEFNPPRMGMSKDLAK